MPNIGDSPFFNPWFLPSVQEQAQEEAQLKRNKAINDSTLMFMNNIAPAYGLDSMTVKLLPEEKNGILTQLFWNAIRGLDSSMKKFNPEAYKAHLPLLAGTRG